MLKRFMFWLTHWCFNHNDYEEALRDAQIAMLNNNGNYMEKADLAYWYDNPTGGRVRKQEIRTSGSTGTPVRFWCDNKRIASSLALVDLRFKQLGKTKGDVFMRLWYPTTGHTPFQMFKEKLYRKLTNEKFFSYFDLASGEKTLGDLWEYMDRNQPTFIEGYAGGIIALASWLTENKLYPQWKIKCIVTGAGWVTPQQHELIEKAFRCKHRDRYGCSEFGEIAHQIKTLNYTPNPYLEIEVSKDLQNFIHLKDAKDGNYEIFVTDRRNRCTPFRRYRMHDVVKIKNKKIVEIIGRTEKVYTMPDGTALPTGLFYQAMKDFTYINQWQAAVEPDKYAITLRTTPTMLKSKDAKAFVNYFDKKYDIRFEQGGYEYVGRRKKLQEIIVK